VESSISHCFYRISWDLSAEVLKIVQLFWTPFEGRTLMISHQDMFPLMIHFLLTLKGLQLGTRMMLKWRLVHLFLYHISHNWILRLHNRKRKVKKQATPAISSSCDSYKIRSFLLNLLTVKTQILSAEFIDCKDWDWVILDHKCELLWDGDARLLMFSNQRVLKRFLLSWTTRSALFKVS